MEFSGEDLAFQKIRRQKKVPHCSTNFPADTLEVILSELLASTDVTLVLGRLRIKINGPKFLRNG